MSDLGRTQRRTRLPNLTDVRRLSLWLRTHPLVGDTIMVAFLILLDVLSWGLFNVPPENYYSVGALLLCPLIIRRRQPVFAAGIIAFGALLRIFTHPDDLSLPRVAEFGIFIALYTLVLLGNRRVAIGYLLFSLAQSALLITRAYYENPGDENRVEWLLINIFWSVALPAFCWLLGEFVAARRAYHAEVEQRLRMLELERDQQTKIAVAQERTRIARELHDVVAHAVSVIIVQADGASFVIKEQPVIAERSLRTIASTGRQALNELRRLLGVLRAEDENPEMVPQPNAGQLAELVDKVRSVGLPIELELTGDLDELPTGVGLGIYRIVQEALTNILKHAGPGAMATVRVDRREDSVTVQVLDDGFGTPGDLVTGGNGLIGMRERAAVYGGTLDAGPREGGGWQVNALLPLSVRPTGPNPVR
ncbi:sensor histidine kinase [Allokutzneria sp. A3M-2-11 16]|uniref:sensor histidine kinase n=1 Tax=Allokutzneria sp. A3M-2-11 16 TaxID=2962043 RepID=UPI003F8D4290